MKHVELSKEDIQRMCDEFKEVNECKENDPAYIAYCNQFIDQVPMTFPPKERKRKKIDEKIIRPNAQKRAENWSSTLTLSGPVEFVGEQTAEEKEDFEIYAKCCRHVCEMYNEITKKESI